MERIALAPLIRTVIEDYDLEARQSGLCLKAEIAPDLPPIYGAPADLRRALANLLGNAVKFTPAGGTIALVVSEAEHSIVIQVSDTGIGIPREEHERVFERFHQVNGDPSQRSSGVGLGLALVKEIIEAHEGTVTVESEIGRGSIFSVILPIIDT
jgi:two-component system phosphate regulon sensor histidine kinase PhoR